MMKTHGLIFSALKLLQLVLLPDTYHRNPCLPSCLPLSLSFSLFSSATPYKALKNGSYVYT